LRVVEWGLQGDDAGAGGDDDEDDERGVEAAESADGGGGGADAAQLKEDARIRERAGDTAPMRHGHGYVRVRVRGYECYCDSNTNHSKHQMSVDCHYPHLLHYDGQEKSERSNL
jgi:hypothetical protein